MLPKYEGGLGIHKTEYTSMGFLAKQGWKILTQPDNIWVTLVQAKYLKSNSLYFLRAKNLIWPLNSRKSLLNSRDLLKQGFSGF